MDFIAIALLLTFLTLLLSYVQYYYNYWERQNVPHEKPRLIVGNLSGIGRSVHFRDINKRLYVRFKAIGAAYTGLFFFFQKAALIIDLELIKYILIKDFSNFHDRGIFSNARDDPLTAHLLSLEGQQWRAMRTKLTPVFTSGKMRFMFPTVVDVAKNLISACATLSKENQRQPGVIELKELSARYTTDVIGTCAFGIECNSLHDPQAEFRRKGRMIFKKPRHSPIIQAFMFTNPKLARRMRLKFFSDDVSSFFMDAVQRTVKFRQENNVKRNDFMDMLIEMKAQNEELARAGKGIDLSQGLTLEQIAAQAFVFFIAGFDTSSTTMAMCLYELALNTHIQDRLRAEIQEILAKHNGELNYECLQEMTYLDQVITETLRKYPVIPHIVRKTLSDYVVPQTQKVIERGTLIIIPVDAIHHDPEFYPQPEKFDPDRFTQEAIQQRHPYAYLPFGDGPRNCIGMRFGKMQAKVGLITLLHSYKLSRAEQTEVPLTLSKKNFLLEVENGIYLQVDRIKLATAEG